MTTGECGDGGGGGRPACDGPGPAGAPVRWIRRIPIPRTAHLDAKRLFDVAGSAAGLVLASPVMAIVALAVRWDSPGPVVFTQTRVGRGGRPFTVYKFRTMTVASHAGAASTAGAADTAGTGDTAGSAAGMAISPTGDARVTRTGRVLRASKLDELPQLLNVLRGDMSLVGPRPEVPGYVECWDPARRDVILSVRPGITDPASVEYRHEANELAAVEDPGRHYVEVILPRKEALYVDYVRTRSLRSDVLVLLRTLRAVLRR